MRYLHLSVASFLLLVFASSCASVGKLNTPSTRPEITIQNTSKKSVLEALAAWSAMKGRQIEASTEYSVTTIGALDARTNNNVLWDESVIAKTIYTPVVKGTDITLYSQRLIYYVEENDVYDYSRNNSRLVTRTSADVMEDYNTQRAYEEMQIELEDFARFMVQQASY